MWYIALVNVLSFLFRTALGWFVTQFTRLFSLGAGVFFYSLLNLTSGHLLFLTVFVAVIGVSVKSLLDMANSYLYDLLNTGSFSDEIWLCFMSLLPVNLTQYISAVISAQAAVLGVHFLVIYSRELLRITTSPFALPFLKK
ncbi:hypothetical protein D6T51_14745 [Salmonella enterica subsp. enterica serovar Muenchen]|nr:hypothetical protein [Salmonella enterica subsp. enterica serovar Muenchen]EBY9281619.1 hypothetical protein [Salmonella enterica subsp. enterica serovar Denver]ECD5428473.1 hypothetical protein [Salmonella enterica subsp. enterica serovar Denver]EJM3644763.1 hypothetical protein [Salmonella enterica]HCM3793241.1 hypothetical protein [Salmonella enterica subsp. enterica serovar Denver]